MGKISVLGNLRVYNWLVIRERGDLRFTDGNAMGFYSGAVWKCSAKIKEVIPNFIAISREKEESMCSCELEFYTGKSTGLVSRIESSWQDGIIKDSWLVKISVNCNTWNSAEINLGVLGFSSQVEHWFLRR